MSQHEHTHASTNENVANDYKVLLTLEPKIIASFVPEDTASQKDLFLEGKVLSPHHTYGKIDAIEFEDNIQEIDAVKHKILSSSIDPRHRPVYEQFANRYIAGTHFLEAVWRYNHATTPEEKQQAAHDYMKLNIEQYGAPEEETYRSLLNETLTKISGKNLTGKAAEIREELFLLTDYNPANHTPTERFKPSEETIQWMHDIAEELYGGMLSHVPDKAEFSADEIRRIFGEIIDDELGEAAADWTVEIEAAKSINVQPPEKRVVIPENRANVTRDQLRRLIVHELGVHLLRSVIGGETDLYPMAISLSEYMDAEEGLGKVMEQALDGKYEEAGIGHYITVGAAYCDGKSFREVFEMKWRIALLEGQDEEEVDSTAIEKARLKAYSQTMRIFRGTDELPWFKDLSYYNGTMKMWQHLEAIQGDDIKFMFVLMGKIDPSNIAHERIAYETRTV